MRLFNKGRLGQSSGTDTASTAFGVGGAPGAKEADMFGDRGHVDEGGHVATTLGKGSQITGKLSFEGTVRIDGGVDGEISAQESVVIGETAVVKAHVTADSIIITGKVTGDLTARRRVEIRAPGKLYGNITTPSLVIHDGVVFEGRCSMGTAGTGVADRDVGLLSSKEEPDRQQGADLGAESEVKWSASH